MYISLMIEWKRMKPINLEKRSIIKRAKYKVSWYKDMVKLLRNKGKKITDSIILYS